MCKYRLYFQKEWKKVMTACLAGALCAVSLTGCSGGSLSQESSGDDAEITDAQLFPTPDRNFVGDPMPFYEDDVFHIFYLADQRAGSAGYHPWALYETSNFYEYDDIGVVIPYADSMEAQDIALGTGCVIKGQDGMYHAFYTGHNDTYEPKEAVMHATSTDMYSWTKCSEDTLYAGASYSANDFRDPYVLYVEEEGQYWMLVSTRNQETGIVARYTSKDLKKWTDEGEFFVNDMGSDSNLECASLLSYGGKWYLSFSDQWPNRLFHYRVSDNMNGPFEIPSQDAVDGNGFYAGRLETDGDKLYVFGWNGTKEDHRDDKDYYWGGNLVVHQLEQRENGELYPVVNKQIKEHMRHKADLTSLLMTETIKNKKNSFTFAGTDYETIGFESFSGSNLLELKIKDFQNGEKFGFAFDTDGQGIGNLNIVFDVKGNKIEFYNTNKLYSEDPQSEFPIDLENTDELNITMLVSGGVVSLYVNDQCAFTARMYASQWTNWGIFGINTAMQCEDIKLYQ